MPTPNNKFMPISARNLLAGSSISALMVCSPGFAQTAPEQRAAPSDEIVVTAQFRSQNLQDTALAITALDDNAMAARSMTNIVDIAAATPSLMLRPAGSAYGPATAVYIRGVGQYDSSYAYEPGVGMYIDDVYHGSLMGSMFELLDLERVEVLRGPQGTLAGKNSIGGAVKLFTKKPDEDADAYLEAGYGRFNRIELKGASNFTLIPDKLYMRVSGMAKNKDGFLTRYDYGCLNPGSGVPTGGAVSPDCKLGTEGGVSTYAGRVALRWTPTDRFEANLTGLGIVENNEPPATKLTRLSVPTSAIPAGIDQSQFLTGPESYSNYATYSTNAFSDPAQYDGVPGAGDHEAFTATPGVKTRAKETALTMDYELSDNFALKSISSYQNFHGSFSRDVDLSPYGVNTTQDKWSHEQFTQELRLNGSLFDGFLETTVGGFFYKATSRFYGAQYNMPGAASENLFINNDKIPARSYSGFAHAVAHLTDRLNVTGGIRYTNDKKDYTLGRLNPYLPSQPTYTRAGALDGLLGSYAGDRVDYRANVDYRWSDALMTYAQFSTGYKGGGVNPRPFVAEQAVSFDPETVNAYEVGFKSDLFDNMLRLNGAVFLNKYQDIIFTNSTPTPNSTRNATPTNAGDADIKGAELELTLRPLEGLLIDGSVSYLDFEFTRIGAAGATIAGISLDNKAPNAPEWKWNVGAQYTFYLPGDAGSITPRFDANYQASFFANVQNSASGLVDSYTLANARVTWRAADETWEAAFAVTNLFDNFYYLNKLDYPIGATVAQPGAPREWKLSVRRNF